MAYTTVDRVKNRLGNIFHLDNIDTVIEQNIENADGVIDTHLSVMYVTPIVGTVPAVIRGLSEQLAAYFTAIDYIPMDQHHQMLEVLEARYRTIMSLLDRIAQGKLPVPGIALHPDSGRRAFTTTTETTPRFFDIDSDIDWGFSKDNLDEVRDRRNSDKVRLPDE